MKLIFLLSLAFLFGITACNQFGREHSSSKPADSELLQSVSGDWTGVLPCADCSGIQFELSLHPDGTYAETSVYEGKNAAPVTQEGKWSMSADSVVMLEKEMHEGQGKFLFRGNQLRMLDIQGNEIVSKLADQYILSRKEISVPGEQVAAKRRPGVDFTARGNEPFWLLEIDFEKGMYFHSLNEPKELNTPVPELVRQQDAAAVSYRAQTEAGNLFVTILKDSCFDSMSGQGYPYAVTVSAKVGTDAAPTELTGCGMYIIDYRLNDIWALEKINGVDVKPGDFPKGVPVLEFHLNDNTLMGNGGCNQLKGNIEIRGNQIEVSPITSTRMACPGLQIEQQLLEVLSGKTLSYQFDALKLILSNEKNILVFKKVD